MTCQTNPLGRQNLSLSSRELDIQKRNITFSTFIQNLILIGTVLDIMNGLPLYIHLSMGRSSAPVTSGSCLCAQTIHLKKCPYPYVGVTLTTKCSQCSVLLSGCVGMHDTAFIHLGMHDTVRKCTFFLCRQDQTESLSPKQTVL